MTKTFHVRAEIVRPQAWRFYAVKADTEEQAFAMVRALATYPQGWDPAWPTGDCIVCTGEFTDDGEGYGVVELAKEDNLPEDE